MKIGVMGGTFDPIHLGHLRAAETAREGLQLDRVAFVPAGRPPHRRPPLSSALDRFAMVSLATTRHPHFLAWDVELRREGASYTVDTVASLLAEHPEDSVVVIVGSDTFPEMTSWRDPQRLFALCTVAVVIRPGDSVASSPPRAPYPEARGVEVVAGPGLPISSTAIRQRVREGLSVRYLVPEEVAEFIAKGGLYA